MGQTCQIIRDAANQVIKVLVVDTASQAVVATAIVPRYFSGVGPPNAGTLPGVAKYNQFDRYTDTSVPSDYICTFAGSPSTSSWKQISGGGSGATSSFIAWVVQDNGANLICTSIPPNDKTLNAASGVGGTGYKVGDKINVGGGTKDPAAASNAASISVTSVDGNGAVLGVSVATPGAYTVAPSSPQTLASATGSGASFTLVFGPPIPFNVNKQPDMDMSDTTIYYQGVAYSVSYTAAAAQDGNSPPGNPGFVYWTRTVNGNDGSSETDDISPPYRWGQRIKVEVLADGTKMDSTTRIWAEQ